MSKFFRRPTSANERRQAENVDDDGQVRIRAKRNANNLPHAFDDTNFSRQGRSWKRNRRTKWK